MHLYLLKRIFAIDINQVTKKHKILLITLLIITCISFLVTIHDTYKYGGIDLRDRVVAARAFLSGIDPYKYELIPPADDRLLDPSRDYPGPSRATVTPMALIVYGVTAWLPYKIQRWEWFILQWGAMLWCIILLIRTINSQRLRIYFLYFVLLFFASGYFWRLHVEKGQSYIFYTLLLSISIYLEILWQRKEYAGIPLGILILLRPPFILLFPLYLLFKKYKTVQVMATTATICFLLTIFIGGFQSWFNWRKGIKNIELSIINQDYLVQHYVNGIKYSKPSVVEGVDFSMTQPKNFCNVTLFGLAVNISKRYSNIFLKKLGVADKLMAALFILYSFILAYLVKKKFFDDRFILLYSFTIILSIDYFVPIRYPYADVMFLPILSLFILFIENYKIPIYIYIGIFLSFAIGHPFIPVEGPITGLLRSFLFMGTMNLNILLSLLQNSKESPASPVLFVS